MARGKLKIYKGIDNSDIKNKGVSEGYPSLLDKPIRISKVRDARRLLGKLILEFQKGNIANQDAKDLCYLVTSYVNVAVQSDFEERLQKLEAGEK